MSKKDELSFLRSLNGGLASLGLSDVCGKVRFYSVEETELLSELVTNVQSSANLYKAIAGERFF